MRRWLVHDYLLGKHGVVAHVGAALILIGVGWGCQQ